MTSWAEITQRNNPSMNTTIQNHNNNSYSTIPHKNLRDCGAVHYQHQHPLDNLKGTSTINAYMYINMAKSWMKHDNKKYKQSTSTVNAYFNTNAFHTHSTKYKYNKCMHQYQHDNLKSNTEAFHTQPPII